MTTLTFTEPAFTARFKWDDKYRSECREERTGRLMGHRVWYSVSTNPSGPLGQSRSTVIRFAVDDGTPGKVDTMGGRGRAAQEARQILRERVALADKTRGGQQ